MKKDIRRGVTFRFPGGQSVHSFYDLGMYISACPIVSPPEPYMNIIDIPGMDGSLDLTESLGRVHYKSRTISMSFMHLGDRIYYPDVQSKVLRMLNGRKCEIIFDDDPMWAYSGRCVVDGFSAMKHGFKAAVSATVNAYKIAEWDTIHKNSFGEIGYPDGIERYYKDIEVADSAEITIHGCNIDVCPTWHVDISDGDADVTIEYTDILGRHKETDLQDGGKIDDLIIHDGANVFTINCDGAVVKVSCEFRGGVL